MEQIISRTKDRIKTGIFRIRDRRKDSFRGPVNEQMKNRVRNSAGMSLGEVLLATLIILLATSVLVATVSLAISQYKNSLSRSEANTLSSTLQSIMTNELAYTTEIHVKKTTDTVSEVTSFQSQNYANSGALSIFDVDSDGHVVIRTVGSTDSSIEVLGDGTGAYANKGSYPNDIKLDTDKKIVIKYDQDKYTFTVSFSIVRLGTTLLTEEFQVINVNHTEPTT